MAALVASDNTGLNPMSFSDANGNLVFERLRYQRETGRFCDVSLVVKERHFSAHRNILASCSPYFDSIFKYSKITKEQVTVNCQSPSVFELLLNYMYSGTVIIDRNSVSELLRLANNLLITKLKNYCAEYLDRYLDAANCLSVKNLANRYNIPTLLKAASDYFDININQCLLESTDILSYTYGQLIKLLQDQRYSDVITADTHLKLIVRWVGEDANSREILFRVLLEQVRFGQVSEDSLEFLLDYSPLLAKSSPSRFLVLHLLNENGILLEKYNSQYINLRQTVSLPPLHDPLAFGNDEGISDDGDADDGDYPVEGHPTAAQIIEADSNGNPHIKLRINISALTADKKKAKKAKPGQRRRGRPRLTAKENEMIPMVDDDAIDGVYATCSLEGAHTYGPVDMIDPDELSDGDEAPVEGGHLRCIYCGFPTDKNESLEKHRAKVHNRNTYYLCHMCNFETNWSKEFYDHCQEHWNKLPYECEFCPFVAQTSIQDFLSHRLSHTDDRFFKCGECAWKGRTRSQLFAHERMHSVLDNRPLHCEECGRGFQQHSALDQHVSTHNEPRNFVCDECGFATRTSNSLAMHRRQHTGDEFFCHIAGCDYSSTKKSQLAAHLRTHMAVRAHMCKVCGRGFIEKSHLVRHERIHLEDKPFKCDRCEYASSRRDKLKEHILKHHNGQTTTKAQRRRYKRQKMLAAAASIVQNVTKSAIPSDALFKPIPVNETVSRWAQSNDFETYSPQPNDFPTSSVQPMGTGTFSPPRAFSVTNPSAPQPTMSPGCMSMMNVPISEQHAHMHEPVGSLMTPTPRSPHNRSVGLFGTRNNEAMNRPLSLPNYGQMDAQQQQQQTMDQQQSQMPDQSQWW